MHVLLAPLVLPLATTPTLDGFSWPQWDGPDRSGISKETEWSSEGKAEPLWTAELGLGYSTVAVKDGRVVTMGYDKEKGLDTVFCFDALTGKEIWSHSYPSEIWDRAHEGGTVNTPSFDGDVVYSLNREGNMFCFDAATGDIRWHNFLMEEGNEHKLEYPVWGFSASPLVLEDGVYVNCGRLLSIDRESGEVLWRSDDYGHGYGTPIAFDYDDEGVLAVLNGKSVAVVLREDGSEIYAEEFSGKQRGVNASTPILLEEDSFFVSSTTRPGSARLKIGDEGFETMWENREMISSLSGCVRVADHLYGFDGQVLKCIDLDGNAKWEERGIGNGAVLAAGDRLLIMGGTGEFIVAKASPEKYEVLSKKEVFDGGRYWTKPVLVNGVVYCRSSRGAFVALDHRKAAD